MTLLPWSIQSILLLSACELHEAFSYLAVSIYFLCSNSTESEWQCILHFVNFSLGYRKWVVHFLAKCPMSKSFNRKWVVINLFFLSTYDYSQIVRQQFFLSQIFLLFSWTSLGKEWSCCQWGIYTFPDSHSSWCVHHRVELGLSIFTHNCHQPELFSVFGEHSTIFSATVRLYICICGP